MYDLCMRLYDVCSLCANLLYMCSCVAHVCPWRVYVFCMSCICVAQDVCTLFV